jgi:phosphatidylserine/phosphatidylglycerophosphate/cardiolipin synthase-like enzyme
MLGAGHIGHNKFVVYVDRDRKPKAVLSGSTNWTATGLCAQTNNAVIFESEPLARQYLTYWQALKQDAAQQGAAFRTRNARTPRHVTLPAGEGKVRAWFSPNTPLKSKPASNPATPADMDDVFGLIHGAKQGVVFLAFIPGSPGIVTELRQVYTERVKAGGGLFVRGAVTDRATATEFNVNLFHRTPRADAHVSSVAGIGDQFSFWQKELSQLGYAVIHDKILVVDPFTDHCSVVTGSHNLGFKASYANDENLVIIRGNRHVAAAYTAHVLDVYDHFRWRWRLQEAKAQRRAKAVWQDLAETDRWQDKYFDPRDPASADDAFWAGA